MSYHKLDNQDDLAVCDNILGASIITQIFSIQKKYLEVQTVKQNLMNFIHRGISKGYR